MPQSLLLSMSSEECAIVQHFSAISFDQKFSVCPLHWWKRSSKALMLRHFNVNSIAFLSAFCQLVRGCLRFFLPRLTCGLPPQAVIKRQANMANIVYFIFMSPLLLLDLSNALITLLEVRKSMQLF